MLSFVLPMLSTKAEKDFVTEMYGEFSALMFATARKYVSNQSAAEDVVQDGLVKLIRNTDILQEMPRCALASYIVSTIRNTAIDSIRGKAVEEKRISPLSLDDLHLVASREDSVEDMAMLRDDLERMKAVWPRLEEEHRFLLDRKYLAGASDAELAEYLDCKPGSVRMKLTRARRRVMDLLKEGGTLDEQL